MMNMRNKENFISDFEKVANEQTLRTVDPVEDASHAMNQSNELKYVLPNEFSKTGKDESFIFEKNLREKTGADLGEVLEDYFYIGRGE
jgi:hypothetical protein